MSKIGKILILFFVVGGVFAFAYGFAQVQKVPDDVAAERIFQAQQRYDKVDRNQNKILDHLDGLIGPAAAGDRFDVVVMMNASLDLLPVLKSRHGEFTEIFSYPAINGFAVNLSKGQIIALSQDEDIKLVEFDALVFPHLDSAQNWFGTAKARTDFGVDGNADGSLATYSAGDVVIAVLDTGIDPSHVDLDGGKIIAWRDATINNDQTGPYDELGDCVGHGSHVASIAAGEGQGNPNFKGVAPGAALVGIKVLSLRDVSIKGKPLILCTAATSEIVSGVQWMIDNKATYGIEVANMSVGSAGCSSGTDSLSTIVNSAVSAGIVMTVSAGNEGPGTCTVGSPAAAASAITVGAMSDVTPRASSASFSCGIAPYRGFYQVCFSSRGLTFDGRLKPDVSSPGGYITAVAAGTVSSYKELSGTSMASPFTAGLAALMLDANPGLTPAQVKSIIESGSVDWGPAGKDLDYGSGRLQGYEAVKTAGSFSGTNVSTPDHSHFSGALSGTGDTDTFDINVADASLPLAATLIITGWSGGAPDFDLEILDAGSNPLFTCGGGPNSTSPCGCTVDANGICKSRSVQRQETVGFQPTAAGIYKVRVISFSGSGSYFVDVSAGLSAPPTVAISLTSDAAVDFGVLAFNVTADTAGDIQTISVDTGPADLDIKSTVFFRRRRRLGFGRKQWRRYGKVGIFQRRHKLGYFDQRRHVIYV